MTSTHPSALAPGFAALKEAVLDRYDMAEPLALNDAAQLLREVADLQADFSLIRSSLEEQLAANMETDRVETPHGVLLRRYRPLGAKWDGRRLAYAVAERIAPVDEDGARYDPSTLIEQVTEELIATAALDTASHRWRTGELKRRNLDPKNFCSTDGWKTVVSWE